MGRGGGEPSVVVNLEDVAPAFSDDGGYGVEDARSVGEEEGDPSDATGYGH